MPRILAVLSALLLLQGLALGVYFLVEHTREAKEEPFRYERLSGKLPAPELALQRGSVSIRLSDLRGEFVLVHFWATWCEPCREELPALLKLSRELSGDERVRLLAISEDRKWETVESYFHGQIPPEVVWDSYGAGEKSYEVSTLPDTYLLSPKGNLLIRFGGARDWASPGAKKRLLRELNHP